MPGTSSSTLMVVDPVIVTGAAGVAEGGTVDIGED